MSTTLPLDDSTTGDALQPVRRRAKPGHPGLGVLLVTCAGAFLVSLDVSVANALLPSIGATFHITDRALLAWIITGYAIVFAAALVPAGRLADRVGRRRIYVAGLLVFALGSTVCGLAPDLDLLIVGRVVQGIGAATVAPASMGLLLAAADATRRSTYAARWTGAAALGVCAGPILGGTFTSISSWRWAFLVNLPVIAALCLAHRFLPATPKLPGRSLGDPIGAMLLAAGAAAVTFGISEVQHFGVGDIRIAGSLVGGAALVWLFVRRCGRVPEPLLDLRLLLRRQSALATTATALYSSAFFGLLLSFVLFMVDWWRFSVFGAGLAILPIGTIVAVMTLRVGRLGDRIGFRLPLTVGASLMAAGLVIAALSYGPRFSPIWFVMVFVLGAGIGLCYPLLVAAAVAGLPASELSAATAVNQCARQLGAALGIAVSVAVLGPADLPPVPRFHLAWLVGAAFCVLSALCALGMQAKRQG